LGHREHRGCENHPQSGLYGKFKNSLRETNVKSGLSQFRPSFASLPRLNGRWSIGSWILSVTAIESAARVWRDYVDAAVAKGQRLASEVDRLLCASNRLLGASSRRTRMLIAIAAAIVSLALVVVILLEISVSDGTARNAGDAVVEATPIPPPVGPAEVQPMQPLAALMGAAPAAEPVRTPPAESSAALRVPLPRPRPLSR
jgi:hypothetical protein